MLRATFVVDGYIPQEGAGLPTDIDTDSAAVTGVRYRLLFNNENKQTNGDNLDTGCGTATGGRVPDRQGHWADGYYKFLGASLSYDGTGWTHGIDVGTYDPSPGGGFRSIPLDATMAGRVQYPSVTYTSGATYTAGADSILTVAVSGVVRTSNPLCVGGYHEEDFASDNRPGRYDDPPTYNGDRISNVNGLTTLVYAAAREAVSDTTDRSTGGPVYSAGAFGDLGGVDTLGPTATCPTPTFGGVVPHNPFWTASPNQQCHVDDDLAGNAVLVEFRESHLGFTANFS